MKRIILSLGVLLMLAQNGFAISDTQYVAYSNGRKGFNEKFWGLKDPI